MGKGVLRLCNQAICFALVGDQEHVFKFMGAESEAVQPVSVLKRCDEIIFSGGNDHIAGC
ncbi:MAG: hypothetical protein BWY75_01216 [bacterium ADurb.Bin425]|nr:MAG: hypothetical protein BWY75_01216 [bacterium ADurb.Bin425]